MFKKQKLIFIFVAALIIGGFFISNLWQSIPRAGELKVAFLNIGQGDSTLIIAPDKSKILIDGGPDEKVLGELAAELPFYDRELDLVILTHPHADHLDGLLSVLERYTVRKVLMTGVIHTTDNYINFLETLKAKNIPVEVAVAGKSFDFGGATFKILWPEKDLSGERVSGGAGEKGGLNDTSVVAMLEYGKSKFLFTGDAGFDIETRLVASSKNNVETQGIASLRADVLKVGHHGSAYASSDDFLRAVRPEYAVASAGKDNRYGHPSRRAVRRLERAGAKIFTTFQDGRIVFVSDGERVWKR
ncbi:MAG: ComEC/Rec2 family competence protein [Patescibacteria group bacterium]